MLFVYVLRFGHFEKHLVFCALIVRIVLARLVLFIHINYHGKCSAHYKIASFSIEYDPNPLDEHFSKHQTTFKRLPAVRVSNWVRRKTRLGQTHLLEIGIQGVIFLTDLMKFISNNRRAQCVRLPLSLPPSPSILFEFYRQHTSLRDVATQHFAP